jgi:hypothetical protein
MPEVHAQATHYAMPGSGTGLGDMLLDIHGERLDSMNEYNVEHFVLVCNFGMRSDGSH